MLRQTFVQNPMLSTWRKGRMKRTQIQDFEKIEQAKDLEDLVKDKRVGKRANKKKANRRNRHYGKDLLRHLNANFSSEESED